MANQETLVGHEVIAGQDEFKGAQEEPTVGMPLRLKQALNQVG